MAEVQINNPFDNYYVIEGFGPVKVTHTTWSHVDELAQNKEPGFVWHNKFHASYRFEICDPIEVFPAEECTMYIRKDLNPTLIFKPKCDDSESNPGDI